MVSEIIYETKFNTQASAAAFNFFLISPKYEASAELYITNTDTVIEFQDVQLSAALTVDYEEILRSRTVLKKVIKDQNLDMTYEDLSSILTISNPTDSHCLILSVQCDEPDQAVNITNSLVKYGTDQIYRIVGKDEPAVIDAAESDAVKTIKPSTVKYGIIGALLGAVALCALYLFRFLTDTTLKSEDDVEKYMNLTVLSAIPKFEGDSFSMTEDDDENTEAGKNT